MLPREAFHVTDVLVVVPWTVAANWSVPPVMDEVEAGEIVTEATEELEGEVAGAGEEAPELEEGAGVEGPSHGAPAFPLRVHDDAVLKKAIDLLRSQPAAVGKAA